MSLSSQTSSETSNIPQEKKVLRYADEVKRAMLWLAEQHNTLFLGQSVAYPGNVIYKNLAEVPAEKKLELPVFEETQMGMSIGLAMEGFVPVSVFPRFNFLLCAASQLVNHLDKIPHMTSGELKPKVIIKTMVGSIKPLHPGIQHCGNFTEAFKSMLDTVEVIDLTEPDMVFASYKKAYERKDGKSTLLVEYGDYYNEK